MHSTERYRMTEVIDVLDEILNAETGYARIFDLTATPLVCSNLVRQFCENNACGKYGANWTCPPAVGSTDECMEKIAKYSKALIFRSEYDVNEWYDYKRIEETLYLHQANVRRIRYMVSNMLDDYLVLSGGGCVYCERCAYSDSKECRHPDISIPPIEAYCIDLFVFAKKNNIVYGSPEGKQYYFGMILFN